MIFREDLEEVFGKRAWDPELTEKPVTNTIPASQQPNEEIIIKDKEEDSEIQAPESPTQI